MNSPESVDVAVNGFGRIGIPFTRVAHESPDLEVIAINNGGHGAEDAAKRLRFDSVHGWWNRSDVTYDDQNMYIKDQKVAIYNFRDPKTAPWAAISDKLVVVDATGAFKTKEELGLHLESGAKKVVLTSPTSDRRIPAIVRGVNDSEEELSAIEDIVSVSSCSTNCIAPITKLFRDNLNAFDMDVSIVHAYTSTQGLLDGGGQNAAARRGGNATIPASSGSQKEVKRLVDSVDSEIACMRTNVPDGSVATMFIECKIGGLTVENVIEKLREATEGEYKGIIDLSEETYTSDKIIGEPASSVIDLGRITTRSKGKNSKVKIEAWFDNEWGYSNRVAELVRIMGGLII